MFKKTQAVQKDMFRDINLHIAAGKAKILDNPNSWHAIFFDKVISQIDESVFSVLYNNGGRPNASIRVLLGMMILKEGNGLSDEQLFSNCRFDLRYMLALGLCHIDDDIPVGSTYYDFRKRLSTYYAVNGIDLVKQSFQVVAASQIAHYNIKGDKIRLDSKLIQSNIRKSTRLELILETIRKETTYLEITALGLTPQQVSILKDLKQKTVSNITYGLTTKEKHQLLIDLGSLIKQLLAFVGSNSMLHRVYDDHYTEEQNKQGGQKENQQEDQGKGAEKDQGQNQSQDQDLKNQNTAEQSIPTGSDIALKDAKQVKASSIQSVHDPEATYRSKGQGASKKQVSGYHSNVAETCNQDNAFNLVIDVKVVPADVCEDAFMMDTIAQSEQVLNQPVTHLTTDGGYDSKDNRASMDANNKVHWNMSKHKGAALRYQISFDSKDELEVYCKKTKSKCEIAFSKNANKYVVTHNDKSKRYFTAKELENYIVLQEHHQSQRDEDVNIRPNVEATIHQMFHRLLKRDKIKYRGMYKCTMYVVSRAFWTNFRRILKNEVENAAFYLFFPLLWLRRQLEALRTIKNSGKTHFNFQLTIF